MDLKIRSFSVLFLVAFLAMFFVLPLARVNGSTSGTTNTSNADPPLNPTAYAAFAGHYKYTAGGAAMRNQGYGNITLTWNGTLHKAYLVWAVINPVNSGLDGGVINGHSITGALQSDDASPCWGNGNLWVFATDVTSFVVNGTNHLTGFASGITDGSDPWAELAAPLDEGATLIVVSTGSAAQQVYLYTGTYTEPNAGNPLTSVFKHGAADSTTAQTTFVVSDGQEAGNYATWNGVVVDSNAFPGSDPHATPTVYSNGNLWDTKTYSVPVTLGATSETAQIGATEGDCLTWTAQVISIPTTAPLPTSTSSIPLVAHMQNRLAWAQANDNLCVARRIENWLSQMVH
ncbi:MAG: hypothetical protein ABR867_04685 [Nitrososphaerales archaeon]